MKISKHRICVILFVFIFWGVFAPARENQSIFNKQMRDALMALYNVDNEQLDKLKEEILAVYQSQGESGLRNFIKERKKDITPPIIIEFVDSGVKEKKEPLLKIAVILAEEKKNEKADILKGTSTNSDRHTVSSTAQSEYMLYATFHIFAQMEVCKFYQSRERSFECLEKLIPQIKKINTPKAQEILNVLKAAIYAFKNDFKKMQKVFNDELVLTKESGGLPHQGNMYLGKGVVYLRNGDYIGACDMFEKALPLYERAGDLKGHGNVYMLWGTLYRFIGDDIRALDMLDKALPFFKKAGNIQGQYHVYKNKAEIHENMGENSKAINMYDKALQTIKITKYNQEKAETYLAKGIIYHKTGDGISAREMYDHALALFENEQDSVDRRSAYQAKGVINFLSGNYSNAIKMYEKSIPFYTEFGHFGGEGALYKTMGELYFLTGNYSKAMEMYDRAFQHYKKLGASELLSHTLHRKAQMLGKLGKNDKALLLFEDAIEKLEKMRRQTGFSWMKMFLMEKLYAQYEETVLFMLTNKYYDRAFEYAESMKARVFLDMLSEGLVKPAKGIAPAIMQKRDEIIAKLSTLSKKINEVAHKKGEEKLRILQKEYKETKREFEDLLVKIRLKNPLYASIQYPEPISVQVLQKEVLRKKEILVCYFISQEKTYISLISRDNFNVIPIKVKGREIRAFIKRYLLALKENDPIRIRRYGKTLYKKLFKPIETEIKESNEVIIVPDGELARIPFESLITDDATYLIEKYRLKYIQSTSVLSVLREYYSRSEETKSFIGFGDPVYDFESFKQGKSEHGTPRPIKSDKISEIHRGKYDRAGGKLPRLQGSGEEVNTIAQLFKKHNQKSVVHVREQANEANAKSPGINKFDYIHFSCHGILGDTFQSLVLSQLPPEKSSEDGYFTLNEIMNCDYNAKLVVLSACQTGSGKMYKGEGVTGLTRAVMYAGTPAVVASLWDVDDRATKELMVTFYKNILEKNMDKVEALRQAKLELLKTKKYSSPLFWSAFIMYGE